MLVALMIAACSEPPTSLESIQNAAPSNQVVAGSPDTPVTFDDHMVQLAETVPGFAGFFVDQAGEVHALSRDMSSRASIVEALDAFLSRNPKTTALRSKIGRMTLHPAAYDFVQLANWHKQALTWVDASVVSTDVDEKRNRVVIGVRTQKDLLFLRNRVASSDVPLNAVDIEVIKPFNIQGSLQLKERPVTAGHRIVGANQVCSIGFPTYFVNDGVGDPYFRYDGYRYVVTAAHCSSVFGNVNFHRYGQPDAGWPIGTEVADPPLFTNAANPCCPQGASCRYSDALLIRLDGSIDIRIGKVPAVSSTQAPFSYSNFATFYNVDGYVDESFSELYQGQGIAITGQTSGRHNGYITNTCVNASQDINGVPTGRWMLCQFMTSVDGTTIGDSGGPVTTGPGTTVTLLGVHWGLQRDQSGVTREVFSPYYFVNREIGDAMGGQLSPEACYTPGCRPF